MADTLAQEVQTSQIEPVIEAYKELVGWKLGPSESGHPLSEHFAKYEEWRSQTHRPRVIPDRVIVLADYALAVNEFKRDWSRPDLRSWLVARLRDPQKCLGFLWEFRYASSLHLKHQCVKWLGNRKGKSPDIQVVCNSGAVVFVECVARLRFDWTSEQDTRFGNVILKALDRKARQRRRFNDPLEITLYVPKQHTFRYDDFHGQLGALIYKRFEIVTGPDSNDAVSSFRVITAAERGATTEPGRVFYDRSMPSVVFPNRNARNPLPPEYWSPRDDSRPERGDTLESGESE